VRPLAIAFLVACVAAPVQELRNDAMPARAQPAVQTLADRLAFLTVTDDDFYRPVLYTWTTRASIAELRTSHQLLVATTQSGGFVSPFNRALLQVSARGNAIAHELITDPLLSRRRYAWPAPFATVLGLAARAYGNALIRIQLRPEAWIGRFDPEIAEPFSFVDASGATIANADAIAHPERIGAVFHVRTDAPVAFREYVVCNPTMVASWSVATPEIDRELVAELALVDDVARVEWSLDELASPATPAWRHATAAAALARWHAALAFDSEKYRPAPAALAAITAALLAYDRAGAALTVEPNP
jgi:hypothetical protein